MADLSPHQATNQLIPPPSRDELLSEAAHEYADSVAARQAAATRDPYLNGTDSARRLCND